MERAGNKYEAMPGQKPALDVLAAKYGETLKDATIPMTDAAIKKLVGGKYDTEMLYVDGQGINAMYGPQARGALLRGKDGMAVCGVEGGKLTSLHPYWAQKYKRELSPAERPIPEKADFLDKINKFKARAAAQDMVAAAPQKLGPAWSDGR